MTKFYTILVIAENKPGVLYRIADLFLRRKINVESLSVKKTKDPHISRFKIEIMSDEEKVIKVAKQIRKIIEVYEVTIQMGMGHVSI